MIFCSVVVERIHKLDSLKMGKCLSSAGALCCIPDIPSLCGSKPCPSIVIFWPGSVCVMLL